MFLRLTYWLCMTMRCMCVVVYVLVFDVLVVYDIVLNVLARLCV